MTTLPGIPAPRFSVHERKVLDDILQAAIDASASAVARQQELRDAIANEPRRVSRALDAYRAALEKLDASIIVAALACVAAQGVVERRDRRALLLAGASLRTSLANAADRERLDDDDVETISLTGA